MAKPAKAKPRPAPKPKGPTFARVAEYREIPVGDTGGIMRAEPGDYIVTAEDGTVSVKPPSVFVAEHPELAA